MYGCKGVYECVGLGIYYVYVYMYIYIDMCVCECVCVCIYYVYVCLAYLQSGRHEHTAGKCVFSDVTQMG